MADWTAAHQTFLAFFTISVATLVLSMATHQKWAAVLAWCIIGNQCLAQWGIDMFDAPGSLMVAIVGDCILALAIYRVYEAHRPGVWSVTMFLIQFTICLADWAIGSSLPFLTDPEAALYGYYLSANILWLLLVACNAGPGARHVAVRIRDYLHRTGAAGSLARLLQRR